MFITDYFVSVCHGPTGQPAQSGSLVAPVAGSTSPAGPSTAAPGAAGGSSSSDSSAVQGPPSLASNSSGAVTSDSPSGAPAAKYVAPVLPTAAPQPLSVSITSVGGYQVSALGYQLRISELVQLCLSTEQSGPEVFGINCVGFLQLMLQLLNQRFLCAVSCCAVADQPSGFCLVRPDQHNPGAALPPTAEPQPHNLHGGLQKDESVIRSLRNGLHYAH